MTARTAPAAAVNHHRREEWTRGSSSAPSGEDPVGRIGGRVSSVLVVVIIGVVIVAVTANTVRGGPKPATRPEPAHRAGLPSPAVDAAIEWGSPPEPAGADLEPGPDPEGIPDERGVLRRLRALAVLVTAVVVLGAAAAAVLGIAVLVAARAVNGALG
jgi:hypothetical protein